MLRQFIILFWLLLVKICLHIKIYQFYSLMCRLHGRIIHDQYLTIFKTHNNKFIDMDQPVIIEDNPKPFIVRVKLLTNEVFEFEVDKHTKVAQFKSIISPKVNVPVDKMRIVFAGKQLVDDKPLSDYVTQSGLTVHLIARSAPANDQPEPQSAQNGQNPQPSSNTVPPPPQINPFGDIMGMMNSMFGGQVSGQQPGNNTQPPPQITMAFGNMNSPLNNQLGGLLGSLGIRIPQPPQQQQQPQPQQSSTQLAHQQSQQPGSQNERPSRISYAQIGQLNNNLNALNLPLDNVTTEQEILTPEGIIRYLRRVHHQSTRSMMQLNRLLNSAENGSTSSLQNFIPIFQSLNSVNNVAINCLNQLQNQRQPQQLGNANSNATHPASLSSSTQTNTSQQNPVVNMGFVVSQVVPNSNQQPNVQQQPQQGFNPMSLLGGMNLGNLLGGLDSVGGINGLFGMSLRDMMSENGESQTNGIMIDLFGGMTGQHIMQAFTTKNFAFLKENRNEIRENLKKKINQSNEQSVIERITEQASLVLIPTRDHPMITNSNQCRQKCKKNLKKHVKKLVAITLSENQPDYDLKVVEIGKLAFCQNVNIISEFTTNKNSNVAFEVIKAQAISTLQPVLPGISGMLYSLIERDLIRIYNQYKTEQERRNQMSHQETESEQRLIQLIKQAGSRDSAKLADMPHSEHYYRQQE